MASGASLGERRIFLHPKPPQPHVRHINAVGDVIHFSLVTVAREAGRLL